MEFREYLENGGDGCSYRQRALTAKSYKNIEHSIQETDTNEALAVLGDSLLKYALCEILFDEQCENITVKKQGYESDEVLVKIIARHYNLKEYLRFDNTDTNIPQNYDFEKRENGKESPHKYIATALEALLAAFFLDGQRDITVVFSIVREWKTLIDKQGATET